MTRHDPAVYPGKYATCVYNHTKALCRARSGTHAAPDLTDCKPLACGNVALTADNRAAWRMEMDTIEADLSAGPLLPPLMLGALERRRGEVQRFLNRHEDHQ